MARTEQFSTMPPSSPLRFETRPYSEQSNSIEAVNVALYPSRGSVLKKTMFLGLCPKLWVGGGQES